VAVAYVVVRWDLGVLPKYTILLATSLGLTLLVYEVVVRRWEAVRFLFGLKPRPRPGGRKGERQEPHLRLTRNPGRGYGPS